MSLIVLKLWYLFTFDASDEPLLSKTASVIHKDPCLAEISNLLFSIRYILPASP